MQSTFRFLHRGWCGTVCCKLVDSVQHIFRKHVVGTKFQLCGIEMQKDEKITEIIKKSLERDCRILVRTWLKFPLFNTAFSEATMIITTQTCWTVAGWRCSDLRALLLHSHLTPAACETKNEINVQANVSSCQSCELQLKSTNILEAETCNVPFSQCDYNKHPWYLFMFPFWIIPHIPPPALEEAQKRALNKDQC